MFCIPFHGFGELRLHYISFHSIGLSRFLHFFDDSICYEQRLCVCDSESSFHQENLKFRTLDQPLLSAFLQQLFSRFSYSKLHLVECVCTVNYVLMVHFFFYLSIVITMSFTEIPSRFLTTLESKITPQKIARLSSTSAP